MQAGQNGSRIDVSERASPGTMMEQEAEFAALFESEYASLVRMTALIVGDQEHARDIAQEAFLQLFARWWRISKYERPDAWVRRVAIRMAVRAVERERTRRRLELIIDPGAPERPMDVDVLRAVAKLPGAQRAAIVLFYFEDRPVADVADLLACSEATARVHLHRARRRLTELLGDGGSYVEADHAS